MTMAWNKWVDVARQIREEKAELQRALARLMKRQLAAAWNKWRAEAAQMANEKKMLSGALRRMLNRKLSMAWEQWQQWANEMRRQQKLMQGICGMHRYCLFSKPFVVMRCNVRDRLLENPDSQD